jgi:trans-2,3-dihydro-3-hydroxyanthranilate isomerase
MIQSLPFYIVDVFTPHPFAGNPLAVIIATETRLTTEQMQTIAREMNYSETTFITSLTPEAGSYPVRIFTPAQELPFAGHPTLGTAYILQQEILSKPVENLALNLPVGAIPVTIETDEKGEIFWMRQNAPTFGQTRSCSDLAPVLGLNETEFPRNLPIREVSTGVPFLMVPLTHYAALECIQLDRAAYFRLIETLDAKAIFVFCPEAKQPGSAFAVRMFGEALGVSEDPATGSANGCFAAYLVETQMMGTDAIDVQVEQGAQIQRPSLLYLRAQATSSQIDVQVGGQVCLIAKGNLIAP